MTNKELAERAYKVIDTHYDFESWYNDCFPECIEEAANMIFSGCCEFSTGSSFEISRHISNDGQTHNFDVDMENFIEFYGGEEKALQLFYPDFYEKKETQRFYQYLENFFNEAFPEKKDLSAKYSCCIYMCDALFSSDKLNIGMNANDTFVLKWKKEPYHSSFDIRDIKSVIDVSKLKVYKDYSDSCNPDSEFLFYDLMLTRLDKFNKAFQNWCIKNGREDLYKKKFNFSKQDIDIVTRQNGKKPRLNDKIGIFEHKEKKHQKTNQAGVSR